MSEDQQQVLTSAADRLQALSARTTAGRWHVAGLLATRPEIIAEFADGKTQHVAEARAGTAEWIATLSPAVATPLANWLRAAADEARISQEALAVARALFAS